MSAEPSPWRASKAADGKWRVIRVTVLGWATRVEEWPRNIRPDAPGQRYPDAGAARHIASRLNA